MRAGASLDGAVSAASRPGSDATARTEAEAWLREFEAGWRDPEGPDQMAAHFKRILDPEVRLVQPQLPTLIGHREFEAGMVAPLFALMPDVHAEVRSWASRGDVLLIELTVRGTLGGRAVAWHAVDRVTLRDGLAIERVTYLDSLQVLGSIALRPRAWPRYARSQVLQLKQRLRKRGTRK
jgi:SnoaL-like domain